MVKKVVLSLLIVSVCLAANQESEGSVSVAPEERGAIWRSAILPGWGQAHLGENQAAKRFIRAEVGIWTAFFIMDAASYWTRDDYLAFAAQHAGINPRERADIYYKRISAYESIEYYNAEMLRQRNIAAVYDLNSGKNWHWDSPANQQQFTRLRASSQRLAKGASFMVGTMLVNRAISAIHVLFLTRIPNTPEISVAPLPAGGYALRLNIAL